MVVDRFGYQLENWILHFIVTIHRDSDASQHDDFEFASLLEEFSNCVLEGRDIPWDRIRSEHPDWVQRLEHLLPAVQALAKEPDVTNGAQSTTSLQLPVEETQRIDQVQLKRMVGRGGMGVVYEGIEYPLERRVAVKLLDPELAGNPRARMRFENEARAAARLQHPNIIPIHAIGDWKGNLYFSMPYVEGVTLAQLRVQWQRTMSESLARDSVLPKEYVNQVLRFGRDAARALHAAHETGVVHRDIKPSNILVEQNGHIWILDFGLACLEGQKTITESGEIVGTLRYMAPERFRADSDTRFDPRLDVYSLGATLYELLALEPPYGGLAQAALLKVIVNSPPKPLSACEHSIPLEAIKVIEKSMERDARDRYASCEDMANDLQRFLDGEQVIARPVRFATRAQRFVQRYPLRFLTASAVAMLVLFLGAIALTWRNELRSAQSKAALQDQLLRSQQDEIRSKQLFLTINECREQRQNPTTGWRAGALSRLATAASDANDETKKRLARNEYAATMMAIDLERESTLMTNVDVHSGKWSPDGKTLAIGLNLPSSGNTCVHILSGSDLTERINVSLPSPKDLGLGDERTVGVRSIAYFPDGERLAVGTRTGMVHVLDCRTGQVLASQRVHDKSIYSLAVSPDGQQVAAGTTVGMLHILRSEGLAKVAEQMVDGYVSDIAWNHQEICVMSNKLSHFRWEGDALILAREHLLNVSNPNKGMKLHQGKYWIGDFNARLFVLDNVNGQTIRDLQVGGNELKVQLMDSRTISLNSTENLMFLSDSESLRIWDYGNGKPLIRMPVPGTSAIGVAPHPTTNERVATWGDRQLMLYRVEDRDAFGCTQGVPRPLTSISLLRRESNDPLLIQLNYLFLNEADVRASIAVDRHDGENFYHNTDLPWDFGDFVCASGDTFVLWDHNFGRFWSSNVRTQQPELLSVTQGDLRDMELSKDATRLIYGVAEPIPGKTVGARSVPVLKCYSMSKQAIEWEFRDFGVGAGIRQMSIKDLIVNEEKVWCLQEDSSLRAIEIATGQVLREGSLGIENPLRLSSAGPEHLVVGNLAGIVAVVNAVDFDLKCQQKLHRDKVSSVSSLPDGTILSAGADGHLVFSTMEDDELQERLRIVFEHSSIEEMHVASHENLVYLRCRNEHVGRWIRVGKLRETFRKIGIDW